MQCIEGCPFFDHAFHVIYYLSTEQDDRVPFFLLITRQSPGSSATILINELCCEKITLFGGSKERCTVRTQQN